MLVFVWVISCVFVCFDFGGPDLVSLPTLLAWIGPERIWKKVVLAWSKRSSRNTIAIMPTWQWHVRKQGKCEYASCIYNFSTDPDYVSFCPDHVYQKSQNMWLFMTLLVFPKRCWKWTKWTCECAQNVKIPLRFLDFSTPAYHLPPLKSYMSSTTGLQNTSKKLIRAEVIFMTKSNRVSKDIGIERSLTPCMSRVADRSLDFAGSICLRCSLLGVSLSMWCVVC